jgi:hypothetical protein
LPAIARPHLTEIVEDYENWESLHEYLLERFERYGQPFFNSRKLSNIELIVLAQHHGLPKRLLDFTTNPIKALFFAVNNPFTDDKAGIVWMVNPTSWREDLDHDKKEFWESEITAFFPPNWNPRLNAQEGCFLCFPMPRHASPLQPITETMMQPGIEEVHCAIVPPDGKAALRRELRRLGISHRTMFPDLDGIARSALATLLGE